MKNISGSLHRFTKSRVFPRSRKECRNISPKHFAQEVLLAYLNRSHVLWSTLGERRSDGTRGQSFWLSSLLCHLAVLRPFCVKNGLGLGFYCRTMEQLPLLNFLFYSLQLCNASRWQKTLLRESSSDGMALIAKLSKKMDSAMVVWV